VKKTRRISVVDGGGRNVAEADSSGDLRREAARTARCAAWSFAARFPARPTERRLIPPLGSSSPGQRLPGGNDHLLAVAE